MSTIGGPGGIGGPKRPGGPDGSSEIDEHADVTNVAGEPGTAAITTPAGAQIEDVAAAAQAAGAARAADVTGIRQAPGAAATGELAALAAEVRAGRLTPHEVIDRLVDATAGPGLDASERAELRELLTDLVANDPHLGGLVGRI
jgi:hypothetical protein